MARALLAILLLLAGCDRAGDHGPIGVSVIGPTLSARDPVALADRDALDEPAAVLAGATRQGLVRFDATGQVVPGLAARWAVSGSGSSLLFRLPDAGAALPAGAIVRRLRAAIAPASRNPLKPLLGAIRTIDAVTPQVIDIELRAPRPNILPLFAQPALGIGGVRQQGGPFDVVRWTADAALLRRRPDPDRDPDDPLPLAPLVRLRGEPVGRAVARFVRGDTQLVLGGRFVDLAIARAAAPAPDALRFDPAPGLFGLAFTAQQQGVAASAAVRRALAMAIDRERIARAFAVPGWRPATTLVPAGTPEIAQPVAPSWSDQPIASRRAAAADIVAAALASSGTAPPLRVAMPAGPGARMLFALIADDWRAIGVAAVAVAADAPADLRLIDQVAPADTAAFYLRSFACERDVPCTAEIDRALIAARVATTLDERTLLLARAEALIAQEVPYIPIGTPIRWSLVAPALDRYRDSPRAIHPLDELEAPSVR